MNTPSMRLSIGMDDLMELAIIPCARLPESGKCCGRKPLIYKRGHHYFCTRCCREYNLSTGIQQQNWAWKHYDNDSFYPQYADSDYVALAQGPRP